MGEPMNSAMQVPDKKPPMVADPNWQAVLKRDPRLDGVLFYAVRSTGIYCRPSCPSRRPRREHVQFFFEPKAAESAGYRPCRRCRPREDRAQSAEIELARRICRFIEENLEGTLTLRVMGHALGESGERLQRTFRRVLGVPLYQYIKARRFAVFKMFLRLGRPVAEATYEAGYSSSSRVYEQVSGRLGMTPAVYRRRGPGVRIRYAVCDSPLGKLLVAATERGICKVEFGESEEKLRAALVGEFARAEIVRDAGQLSRAVESLLRHLDGRQPDLAMPLDIRATAFQLRVYAELKRIPCGQTRTYGEVARAIGMPGGQRAVARACATNPVPIVVPCHRVVRADGDLGGYRFGTARKKALLEMESSGD
jgi:AraC family transcriptional regulator of adaptative response/methylated-DNA-[protein]-cysteine methyltransferase